MTNEAEKQPTPEPQKGNKPKKILVDYPNDLQPVYANAALFSFTPNEMIMDMAQLLPRPPRGQTGRVVSRVIMSPAHAKMMLHALHRHVANYERQFGEIRMPRTNTLADQFFRFSQQGDEDDNNEPNNEDES